MDETTISAYIVDTFGGVDTVTANGDTFFFYDPEHKFPFATLVTSDFNDTFSNLNRPDVFRLNIGISKQTYRTLFGAPTSTAAVGSADDTAYDFTALDTLLPHPVYGRMYWVCVLNPSTATFQTVVQPLLAEAYTLAFDKQTKRASRQ